MSRRFKWFLTVGFVGFSAFAIRYDVVDRHAFMLHSYLFMVIGIVAGLDRLVHCRQGGVWSALPILAMGGPLVYEVMPNG